MWQRNLLLFSQSRTLEQSYLSKVRKDNGNRFNAIRRSRKELKFACFVMLVLLVYLLFRYWIYLLKGDLKDMERERDCEKCIHHIGGSCSKWSCEMETMEEHDKRVKEEVIEKIKDNMWNLDLDHWSSRIIDEETIDELFKEQKNG